MLDKPKLNMSIQSSQEGSYCVVGKCIVRFYTRGKKLSDAARSAEFIQRKLPTLLKQFDKYERRNDSNSSCCFVDRYITEEET